MGETLTREPQAVCGFTGEDYAEVLADLMPTGAVWDRDPESVQMRTLDGLAQEFARVHRRDCDLLAESYPGTCIETLTDWERVCGLPDPCTGPLPTLQERRMAILLKLAQRGGQSRRYITEQAKVIGYDIDIQEFRPFRAGESRAGDRVFHQSSGADGADRSNDWWFTFRVHAPATRVIAFRASNSSAGDPLVRWDNQILECLIAAIKPAHTQALHSYGALPPGGIVIQAIWDAGASVWDGGNTLWEDRLRGAAPMASQIDPAYPVYGTPTTASVRDNFAATKQEIEDLQDQKLDKTDPIDGGEFT